MGWTCRPDTVTAHRCVSGGTVQSTRMPVNCRGVRANVPPRVSARVRMLGRPLRGEGGGDATAVVAHARPRVASATYAVTSTAAAGECRAALGRASRGTASVCRGGRRTRSELAEVRSSTEPSGVQREVDREDGRQRMPGADDAADRHLGQQMHALLTVEHAEAVVVAHRPIVHRSDAPLSGPVGPLTGTRIPACKWGLPASVPRTVVPPLLSDAPGRTVPDEPLSPRPDWSCRPWSPARPWPLPARVCVGPSPAVCRPGRRAEQEDRAGGLARLNRGAGLGQRVPHRGSSLRPATGGAWSPARRPVRGGRGGPCRPPVAAGRDRAAGRPPSRPCAPSTRR